MISPYAGIPVEKWESKTIELTKAFPLDSKYLVEVVLKSWDSILATKIAGKLSIANDVRPKPQIMGFFLHEVIAHTIQLDYPYDWRKEKSADDKDVVCIKESSFSLEIKTSSHKNRIFGNRSYAQETQSEKKSKSSYYIAINFEQFDDSGNMPKVKLIRFGWIDHSDWVGQSAASGQQSRLSSDVETKKLLTIYKA